MQWDTPTRRQTNYIFGNTLVKSPNNAYTSNNDILSDPSPLPSGLNSPNESSIGGGKRGDHFTSVVDTERGAITVSPAPRSIQQN